ncbi:unnamed protein product [Polarella glacialis]|uniref:Transcriptional regulatory protein n=1 Tax=Polarella glacialis TaxID=89957 RepID=A0A813FMJ1_POLGL|nr:unnamed protein product [Polarella glacialis]
MAAAFAVSFLRGASQPRPVTLASSSPGRPGATRGSGVVSSSTSSTAVSAVQRLFALGLGLLSAASFRRASGRAGFGRIIVRGRNFETNIKKKKGPAEAKQARATAKHLRNISMCVREFGANPEVNRALKRAIQAALKDNVPRDTVNNRIKLITEGKSAVSEIQISGVGPQGTAVIVECLTDNANRTRAAVKTIMKDCDIQAGNDGSVDHQFNKLGVLNFEGLTEEQVLEASIEADAEVEDIVTVEDGSAYSVEVTTTPENFRGATAAFEGAGLEPVSTEIVYRGVLEVSLSEKSTYEMMKLLELLEDCDDVGEVHHNAILKEGVELKYSNYGIPLDYDKAYK